MINVLIVEDSLVVQRLLARIIESDPDLRVMGVVGSGEEALEFLSRNKPDIITMDIVMPRMDGFETTRRIMHTAPVPIVVVSASWNPGDVERTFMAIEAGALAAVEKPPGLLSPDFPAASSKLIRTLKVLSEVKVVKRMEGNRTAAARRPGLPRSSRLCEGREHQVVAVGASTGGPPALALLLSVLQKDFPLPILIVQHIAGGFVNGLAQWLAHRTGFPVTIPETGERIATGRAYIAPDDRHMGIDASRRIVLAAEEKENGMRPSVSYLFRSVADAYGDRAIGVLLTGMGQDGARELALMKERGGLTFAQDEESSVVHGMPGRAIQLGGAVHVLPPEDIGLRIALIVKPRRASVRERNFM